MIERLPMRCQWPCAPGFGLFLGAALASVLAARPPGTITPGGPRQLEGSVAVDGTSYTATVTFDPVRAFDPATNEEVNRDLGREFALRVLARHLSAAAAVRFEAAGEEVREAAEAGRRYRVTVRWPKDGVRVLAGPAGRMAGSRVVDPAAFTDRFFTARRDHLDTLAAVAAAARAAGRGAREQAAAAVHDDRRRTLALGVAKAEERGLAAFDALAAVVRSDPNLLDLTERPEVLEAVAAARAAFEQDLRAAPEEPPPPPAFRDVRIDRPFDAYLTASPLLMELGGAAVVDGGGGETLLVGVAMVILKDGAAADLLRAERVCMLKARAAAVGERDGARISYLKRVEDRVVVVTDVDGEKARSVSDRLTVTRETVGGVAKGLPVVGRWRSADGTVFYLAVGGRLTGPPRAREKK